jgi:phosphotransferase system  glucose/maltose/N-acetylglucosamine-specific IIC component
MATMNSLFHSVTRGIGGFVKGLVAGGVVGTLTGAVVGAVAAIVLGPIAIAIGALIGGIGFAGLGSLAGAATGVVHSVEEQRFSAAQVNQAANIAFNKGVALGRNQNMEADAQRNFQEMIEKRRAEEAQKQR